MSGRRPLAVVCLAVIDQLCEGQVTDRVSTGDVARLLGISRGTVSSILGKLAERGLVDHIPYGGTRLTDSGRKQTRRVLRRSRLIELFLCETLPVSRDAVIEEAAQLEPAVSEQLIDRIDAFLNYPKFDPRGAPIPRKDGTLPNK